MAIGKQGLLIDLDGTIYKGKQIIEHAREFVKRLRVNNYPYLFVTNNSSRTAAKVAAHLCEIGIEAEAQDVYTAAEAAAQYIVEQQQGRRVAYIGEHGLEHALNQAGLDITNDQPDYLVQGIDRQFTYAKLAQAVSLIRGGAIYILTNPDVLLPSDQGLIPGAGSISASIQSASLMRPIIIGKPSPIIMNYAIAKMGCHAADVWVIGDNLHTDIGAGKAVGCRTALVLTGITTSDNIEEMTAAAGFKADIESAHLLDVWDKLGL